MDFVESTPAQILDLATPTLEYQKTIKTFDLLDKVGWANRTTALSALREVTSAVPYIGLDVPNVDNASLDKSLSNASPVEPEKTTNAPSQVDRKNPISTLPHARWMSSGVGFMGLHDPDVYEESLDCPTRDGKLLELRVHRPMVYPTARIAAHDDQPSTPASPLIVLFHGGHHVLGFPGTLSATAASLVKSFNAVVVSAGYRLAPEHPFPVGVNDGWDVLAWCGEHAKSDLGADPRAGFTVGGVSNGGTMAVVVAHQARDRGMQPPLTGLYLACADVRAPTGRSLPEQYAERLLSRTQPECVNSPVLPAEMVSFMDSMYQPDTASDLYAPLLWSTGHANLPPTYFQVAGIDVARDEGLVLEDMLRKEGVPTRLNLYTGLPHVFWAVLPDLSAAKTWQNDTTDGFAWLLQQHQKQ